MRHVAVLRHPHIRGAYVIVVRGFWGRLFKPNGVATFDETLVYNAFQHAQCELYGTTPSALPRLVALGSVGIGMPCRRDARVLRRRLPRLFPWTWLDKGINEGKPLRKRLSRRERRKR